MQKKNVERVNEKSCGGSSGMIIMITTTNPLKTAFSLGKRIIGVYVFVVGLSIYNRFAEQT